MYEILDLSRNELLHRVDSKGFRPEHYLRVLEARDPKGLFAIKQVDTETDQVTKILWGSRFEGFTRERTERPVG